MKTHLLTNNEGSPSNKVTEENNENTTVSSTEGSKVEKPQLRVIPHKGKPTTGMRFTPADNGSASPTTSVMSNRSSTSTMIYYETDGDEFTKSKTKKGRKGGSTQKGQGQRRIKSAKPKSNYLVDPEALTVGQVAEDEYVVEKIVGKQTTGGHTLYNIKWKGWATVHNTWEPKQNLEGCPELLVKFEKEYAEEQEKKRLKKQEQGVEEEEDSDSLERMAAEDAEIRNNEKEMDGKICMDIRSRWPVGRIPAEVCGVNSIDKQMVYLVRCMPASDSKHFEHSKLFDESVYPQDLVIVKSEGFRHLYPRLLIDFYASRILWSERAETEEEMIAKTVSIINQISVAENLDPVLPSDLSDKTQTEQKTDFESEIKEPVSPADTEKMSDTKRDDIMEVDERMESEDEDDAPKIFIKGDIFGLPEDMNSSESSGEESPSEDYEEMTKKFNKKKIPSKTPLL